MLGDVLNNMEKANEYYIKAIELNPKIIMVYSNYARFLVSAYKNYDKAMNLLEKASEFDEPVTSVYLNLAYLQIITNNLTKAEENISKALFINMKDNEIYKDLYLWFYRYAIYFHKYPDAYYVIKRLLPKYDEIEQWDFSLIIDIAKKNGHPHINTVIKFAEKISGLVYS
jgi:Tfp pilus assembly protein PilF